MLFKHIYLNNNLNCKDCNETNLKALKIYNIPLEKQNSKNNLKLFIF